MNVITKTDCTKKGEESYATPKANSTVKTEKQATQNYDAVYVGLTTTRSKNLKVAIKYTHPKQQPSDGTALFKEIQFIIRNKSAVIFEDFNCPNINWNSMQGDKEGSRLIEVIEALFLSQIVTQMTRETIY